MKSSISQPLIDGLRNEVVVVDDSATRIWPEIRTVGYKEAVGQALRSQINFLDSPTDPVWWIRARPDDAVGGTGLRWERPDGPLEPGQRVDWWTVEDTGPNRLMLKAEMKVPGEAWLEFRVVEEDPGSELRQTAYFRPRGLLGRLYWWGLWPFHISIFSLMAKRLARRAEFGGSGRKYTRQWFSEKVGRSGGGGEERRSGGEMQ